MKRVDNLFSVAFRLMDAVEYISRYSKEEIDNKKKYSINITKFC